MTSTKKSDKYLAQKRTSAIPQKPTVTSPKKSVESPRQKLKPKSVPLQSPAIANSQTLASVQVSKSASVSENLAPSAPQESRLASAERSGGPAKPSSSSPNLESQQACSSTAVKQQTRTTTQQNEAPLNADLPTKREYDTLQLDKEASNGIFHHTNDREATLLDNSTNEQEFLRKKLPTGCYSETCNEEELSPIDKHFLSIELMCLEKEKQKEEEVEEESGHVVPAAPLSKQSSLDSISQFVSGQFSEWDASSPALSLIQSEEFWCSDCPLSSSISNTPKGKDCFVIPCTSDVHLFNPPTAAD